MTSFSESIIEDAALDWLGVRGFQLLHRQDIAASEFGAELILKETK